MSGWQNAGLNPGLPHSKTQDWGPLLQSNPDELIMFLGDLILALAVVLNLLGFVEVFENLSTVAWKMVHLKKYTQFKIKFQK